MVDGHAGYVLSLLMILSVRNLDPCQNLEDVNMNVNLCQVNINAFSIGVFVKHAICMHFLFMKLQRYGIFIVQP